MPKSIVVGIATVDRRRDFTYPTNIQEDKKKYPTTGHSDKFMVKRHNSWIKRYFHGLGMAGVFGAHQRVGRMLGMAAGITGTGSQDARFPAEAVLLGPETTAGERGDFGGYHRKGLEGFRRV